MDDKLVWTDTVSAFALHDVEMPEVLLRMWGHLRAAVLYFLRYQQGQHSQDHVDRAQNELLRYGHLVQRTWNMEELMTNNLHTCMLHVPEQVRLCGAAAFSAEWWLERLMQVFKRVTKYRCTRFPETSAVQHWLTVAALDDMRLNHPKVVVLLDEIRCGRQRTCQDSTLSRSWLSGKIKAADRVAAAAVEAALRSVEHNHGGDGMRVTLTLDAGKVGRMKPNAIGPRGQGVPIVELATAQTASIKDGKSLVRTRSSRNAKQDCYALVPYSLEAASPIAEAAQVASSAAAEIAVLAQELTGATNIIGMSDRSHEEAMEAAQLALAAAEAAKQHAATAEASAGYNEAAIALVHDLYQLGQAADKALTLAGSSPTRLSAVVTLAAEHCRELAEQLPAKCSQPADPEPASICTLLEIEHLVRWEEEVDGERRIHRLAVGDMTQLEAVSRPDMQFETVFCDGSRGRRKRVPTLLKPQRGARSFKYAVWLDQIECSMVRAEDSSGRRFYVPTNKSSTKG
jgi:hypothetical protein